MIDRLYLLQIDQIIHWEVQALQNLLDLQTSVWVDSRAYQKVWVEVYCKHQSFLLTVAEIWSKQLKY